MHRLDARPTALTLLVALTLSLATALAAPMTPTAQAAITAIDPCDLPVVANACDVIGAVAGAAGDFVMRGVTTWVTNTAVWVTGKVGGLVEATTSPDLQAGWFEGQYSAMVAVAGALALLMLMLAVIQAVIRQDVWLLLRSAFGYLPMAFILAGVAIAGTQLLIWITDDLSGTVVHGLGSQSGNLLNQVGDAYKHALDDKSADAVPLFGVFLGAIILAIGAFVLWLELIVRDAAIYICVFFLPLTFVGMIWPATSRWARRLVELLVAIVLSKFVIVSILTLATAAITGTVGANGQTFEMMLAGAAILVLAAWSPFGLLRMIPMMEVAAASMGGQRAAIGNATTSAGIQSPAGYMRQAMNGQSRAHSSQGFTTTAVHARYRTESQSGSARPGSDPGAAATRGGGEPRAGSPAPSATPRADRQSPPSAAGAGATPGSRPPTPEAPPPAPRRPADPGDRPPQPPRQEG